MRRSAAADTATWQRICRLADAARENTPTLVPALNQARDGGYPPCSDGQPGGKGGHYDLSDRLRYDPAGNLVAHQDPADRDLVERGRLMGLIQAHLLAVAAIDARHLREPASANLCRGGMCPAGNMAAPGKAGRCPACSAFWYKSSSSPNDPEWPRHEREWVGQVPLPRRAAQQVSA